ncbi:hypothetical protein V500_09147 [Pseudogymnoascus sp. VKM F-4518 (FW-2643)]|nr:hypothetical protein V500_09147 [Pseudogymnoascus sp. VKM F-4518 (FW-2643)]
MPVFNPFQSVTGRNSASLFEIRLESDVIVLRGPESEASSQILRGVLVLCLAMPLKVEDVHLRLTGQCRVGWNDTRLTGTGMSNGKVDKTTEILNHRWPNFVGADGTGSSSKGVTLGATNYEWPFEVIIPGSTAESVAGLHDSHIQYKLKATIARGRLAYDLHAYKSVRVIRTLDPAALELSHAMTVENIWPNKLEYSIVIPQKAIVFGTSIAVDMKFTSLLKGLRIGIIKCHLVEVQEFSIPGPAFSSKSHKKSRDIESWSFEIDEQESYRDMLDESGQGGFVVKEVLALPKSLKKCLQDCETHGIKIRHKVKFNIALHNPDGHTSELRASLPVTIFISPNVPLDEAGNLLDQTPNNIHTLDIDSHAPPLYGEHIMDQLYADIDSSGHMTPAVSSGMNTPLYLHSRSGSADNLASLNGMASTAVRPDILSSRLHNLSIAPGTPGAFRRRGDGSGGNTPHVTFSSDNLVHLGTSSAPHQPSGYFDQVPPGVASRSNPISRHPSDEDVRSGRTSAITSGHQTPEHIDYSELSLNKVPSYATAVRAPIRSMTLNEPEPLPNYDMAISAPPSPTRTHSFPVTRAINEQSRNINSEPATPTPEPHRRNTSLSNLGRTMMQNRRSTGDDDAERRLQLLRARAP